MRTITPKQGTPVANFYTNGNGSGKKATFGGVAFWLKGISPHCSNDRLSPYRERAAYLVDKMLSLNIVPHTILMLSGGKLVSAQKFIDGREPDYNDKKPAKMNIFDFLIGNPDRHIGNWLIEGKKVWAIDNAYSFDTDTLRHRLSKEPNVIGLSPADKTRLISKIRLVLSDTQKVHKRLDSLIGEEETHQLISRLINTLKTLERE